MTKYNGGGFKWQKGRKQRGRGRDNLLPSIMMKMKRKMKIPTKLKARKKAYSGFKKGLGGFKSINEFL